MGSLDVTVIVSESGFTTTVAILSSPHIGIVLWCSTTVIVDPVVLYVTKDALRSHHSIASIALSIASIKACLFASVGALKTFSTKDITLLSIVHSVQSDGNIPPFQTKNGIFLIVDVWSCS